MKEGDGTNIDHDLPRWYLRYKGKVTPAFKGCPNVQVVTTSWVATQGALETTVLRAG